MICVVFAALLIQLFPLTICPLPSWLCGARVLSSVLREVWLLGVPVLHVHLLVFHPVVFLMFLWFSLAVCFLRVAAWFAAAAAAADLRLCAVYLWAIYISKFNRNLTLPLLLLVLLPLLLLLLLLLFLRRRRRRRRRRLLLLLLLLR